MAVSLSKGSSISLTKEAGPVRLSQVRIGLGWDALEVPGVDVDLDASVFVLGSTGRVLSDQHFIFYNQLADVMVDAKVPDYDRASVIHHGDNREGGEEGDAEQITIYLDRLSPAAARVVFTVTIHPDEKHNQTFGQVENAFIRVVNTVNEMELARFDLSAGASYDTAFAFGELYREGSDWHFGALGEPRSGGLGGLAAGYGVSV